MGINPDSSSFSSKAKNIAATGLGITAAYGAYRLGSEALKDDVFVKAKEANASKPTKVKAFLHALLNTVKNNPKMAILTFGTGALAFILEKFSIQKTQEVVG